jgi:uncharacterized protein
MKTLHEVIGDPVLFLDDIFNQLADIELDVEKYFLDHICYRVASAEEYHHKKAELAPLGNLLIESMVNGRLIATYKLNSPIVYKNRLIDVIELPSPKPGHAYKSGLEHVEFVTKDPLQKIVDRYPQYAFEVFGIHKKINADITLKLGEYCIRFHNHTLEDVIKEEMKMAGKRA